MAVARTIRQQIGGGALYMIGAKGFGAGLSEKGEPYLQFRIGRNANTVHTIKITLNHLDLYDIEFGRIVRGQRYTKVSEELGIYNEMLEGAIQRGTGMTTSLGTMGKSHGRVKAHTRRMKSGKIVPVREYDISHVSGSHLVTTHLKLKGRGITQLGDGSDHARGLNTYRVTDAAFKKIQQRHGEFHYRNKGESLTPDENRRKKAILAEKNAESQRKWINSVLANDEGSTDAELIAHFRGEGQMSQAEAKHYVGQRSKVLADPMYSTLKPYRGRKAAPAPGSAAVKTETLPTIWKYDVGSAGSYYLTTDIELKGVGIRLHSTNLHGEKIYRLSDLAFEKLRVKYGPPQFTKSMENGSMDTLEKFPALRKAVSKVKGHQRRTASGKVVMVRESQRGSKGLSKPATHESPHPKDTTEYFRERRDYHSAHAKYHAAKQGTFKKDSPGWATHVTAEYQHNSKAGIHGDDYLASQKAKDRDRAKKSQESNPMETINLKEFPALAKAIHRGSLSKSLEFTKSGKEIYMAIMAKIGQLQGELLMAVAQWQAGQTPSPTSVSEGMAAETAEVEKPAKEPWEIRSCRRKIEKLQRICRNIDPKKRFKLSEYDLDEYGL